LILGLTGWTGVFRLIRAEYMKHKSREYVLAAKAIGVSHLRRMFVHIFPNVSHIALVQISILVVSFIKSEVILSFLGFGVPVGVVSWGSMLNEAQSELILGNGGNWLRHRLQWRFWSLHFPCLLMHCVML
jgi:peptide/nickel transport system permease protein